MNVSLTPELELFVQKKVQTGRYNSASEVIREALRSLYERDQLREAQLQELRKKVAEGISSLDDGRGIGAEQARRQLRDVSLERQRRGS